MVVNISDKYNIIGLFVVLLRNLMFGNQAIPMTKISQNSLQPNLPLMNKKVYIFILVFAFFAGTIVKAQNHDKTPVQSNQEYQKWLKTKDDWANLGRYQEANSKLGPPASGEDRVVFMGNSITEGWSRLSPEFFTGKPYINRGISGQTTPLMLIRFMPDVVQLQPRVVVILAGTNDIAGNTGPSTVEMIEDNIAAMAEIAHANGIKVILSSTLPVFDYPWRPGLEPAPKIIKLNNWMKSFAEKSGFIYLDYFSAVVDERDGMQEQYANDGVHPTKKGYMVMEKLVEKAIENALSAN